MNIGSTKLDDMYMQLVSWGCEPGCPGMFGYPWVMVFIWPSNGVYIRL